jgi:hypothetical protein
VNEAATQVCAAGKAHRLRAVHNADQPFLHLLQLLPLLLQRLHHGCEVGGRVGTDELWWHENFGKLQNLPYFGPGYQEKKGAIFLAIFFWSGHLGNGS